MRSTGGKGYLCWGTGEIIMPQKDPPDELNLRMLARNGRGTWRLTM